MFRRPRKILLGLIWLYQKTLSPDHSKAWKGVFPTGHCRYFPSCSEYARLAITKHGALKGGLKSAGRILRCNPWSKGGVDYP
ncbi:MAG: membrane protein insertion efficiency factor YidD [Candidatus Gracilibacteria bacterium]|nr:membrane protein insertion efficiency factor YidD [Candidatus Gracilibacteria bacterium]